MKIAALILLCLVLALSAGVGRALPQLWNQTHSTECCCGCGCCAGKKDRKEGKTADTDAGNFPHHGQRSACPFCAGSFAKGLNAVCIIAVPPFTEEYDADKSLYVCHRYASPFVGGIWQPPKYVTQ